jgi:Protein of unknown function (DUF2442)
MMTMMPARRQTAADRERYARARDGGRRQARAANALEHAAYDASHDLIELTFRSGATARIPRTRVQELRQIRRSEIGAVRVSAAGDVISWRSADVDINVHGLIERVFLTRRVEP